MCCAVTLSSRSASWKAALHAVTQLCGRHHVRALPFLDIPTFAGCSTKYKLPKDPHYEKSLFINKSVDCLQQETSGSVTSALSLLLLHLTLSYHMIVTDDLSHTPRHADTDNSQMLFITQTLQDSLVLYEGDAFRSQVRMSASRPDFA